jgi:hypothetical protein
MADLFCQPKKHIVEWATVAAFTVAAACWMYWPSWQSSRMESDLDFYAAVIRLAPSPLSLKEPLLDRIDAIEDRVWKGGRLDYSRWRRHDAAIRELLKQGLDHETASLIERELNRIERQIDEKNCPDEEAKS